MRCSILRRLCSHRHGASWRSRTSTAPTSIGAGCESRFSAGESPGWIRARTSRCCRQRCSLRRSRAVRGCRSAPRRKSPSAPATLTLSSSSAWRSRLPGPTTEHICSRSRAVGREVQFEPTAIPEVILVRPRVFGDARGFFFESWEERKFAAAGCDARFVQDNHSHSTKHTLRGLHFQIQHAQGKLVRVARGEVFDVAVDIRRSSPRFGQWVGVNLSEANHHMLWVPAGFAHGYLALSDQVDFIYKCTDYYA